MKDKYLVLINQTENLIFPNSLQYCDIKSLYSKNNLMHRIVRKMALKYNISFLETVLFKNWIPYINGAKGVILFDTGNAPYIIRLIKKINPDMRIILWYWNSIKESVSIDLFNDADIEIWSFDKNDCEKYGLKYNTQFYIEESLCVSDEIKQGSDVFYVGADKNRAELLNPLKMYFDNYGINYFFNLVRYHNSTNNYGIEYKAPLMYKDVVAHIKASKAIIDLVADWQSGLTLRPLEALYFKKKLITNMKNIVEYDFYNPNNIFIIGVDDMDDLKEFIAKEYDQTNYDNYLKEYSFKEWLNRF